MKMEVTLSRGGFKALKGKDINALLRKRLPKAEGTLRAEREEFLREKIAGLEERLLRMKGLQELREFYEKALKDRELMMAELDRLRKENAELRAELERKKVHKS